MKPGILANNKLQLGEIAIRKSYASFQVGSKDDNIDVTHSTGVDAINIDYFIN